MSRKTISSGSKWEESYGYSRAVKVGNTAYISGTVAGVDPIQDEPASETAGRQAAAILIKIKQALKELDMTLEQVVRTKMYITSRDFAHAVASEHGKVFDNIRPACTLVVVAGLIEEAYMVEIEAEAIQSVSIF